MNIKFSAPAEPIVKRMFYLAWKAVGGPSGMMGCLQDRGEVDEETVWQNVQTNGDYPGRRTSEPGHAYGDYVFGRMMKMGVNYSDDTITVSDHPIRSDYEAWCHEYPSYLKLADAAARELGASIVAPQLEMHGGTLAPSDTGDQLAEAVKEQTIA